MMINDENKKSFKKMMSGRALYIALGVCVLAAGAVGYSALKVDTPSLAEQSVTERVTYKNVSDARIDETTAYIEPQTLAPSGVEIKETAPAPEASSEEPETAQVFDSDAEKLSENSDALPAQFSLPLSLAMGLDYSMGVPVYSSTMSDYRTHNGVDFTGVEGDDVKAIAYGTVISALSDVSWGYTVSIQHSGGLVSTYCGLTKDSLPAAGASVKLGEVIGKLGSVPVESDEGAHIHLETRINNELKDPLEVLGLNGNNQPE